MYLFYNLSFVDPASVSAGDSVICHFLLIHLLLFVSVLVGGMIVGSWVLGFWTNEYLENEELETYWTAIPFLFIVTFLIPSLNVLYFVEYPLEGTPGLTVKFTGHQWYWSFDVSSTTCNYSGEMFMVTGADLGVGDFRLLEVDLPVGISADSARIVTTSVDVIHSVAFPVLGVKVDAVPGRLNQQVIALAQCGKFYGQCSEICGANHSFMPLSLEVSGVGR